MGPKVRVAEASRGGAYVGGEMGGAGGNESMIGEEMEAVLGQVWGH